MLFNQTELTAITSLKQRGLGVSRIIRKTHTNNVVARGYRLNCVLKQSTLPKTSGQTNESSLGVSDF